ncbi:Hsp70 protein-domain-containing protein [Hysterangium stoloniferum]|nr:Hsp70 protein-domain-containing protein [Hysterangium stoloniferum]
MGCWSPPRHVVFADIGHSSYCVVAVALSSGQLLVKSPAYDRDLGSRDIDYALVQHFAHEFKSKYNINALGTPKATFRLATQVERLKKILSVNTEGNLSVECFMNDVNASSKLTKEQMEQLISSLLNRIVGPLQQALQDAVGGSTRVPATRQRIQSVFPNKTLSTTSNQDEALARGATFSCAMLSPVFRVRHDFPFRDIASLQVYPRDKPIPSTRILSFGGDGPFDVQASYTHHAALPGAINTCQADETMVVKAKTRLNPNGLLSFGNVYVEEEIVEKGEQGPMEVDGAPDGDAEAAPKKKDNIIQKDVAFVTGTDSLDTSMLELVTEKEGKMHASDRLVMET